MQAESSSLYIISMVSCRKKSWQRSYSVDLTDNTDSEAYDRLETDNDSDSKVI